MTNPFSSPQPTEPEDEPQPKGHAITNVLAVLLVLACLYALAQLTMWLGTHISQEEPIDNIGIPFQRTEND